MMQKFQIVGLTLERPRKHVPQPYQIEKRLRPRQVSRPYPFLAISCVITRCRFLNQRQLSKGVRKVASPQAIVLSPLPHSTAEIGFILYLKAPVDVPKIRVKMPALCSHDYGPGIRRCIYHF